jgi:ribonuclease-3 family protein
MENDKLLNDLLKTNLLSLAFIGDSVHTLFVRKECIKNIGKKIENYHQEATKFCKASAQAKALELIYDNLSDEEKEIVRRGRNAHPKHQAKNSSTADYSKATAFESLIGFLYMANRQQRLEEILTLSMKIYDKQD